MKTNFSKVLVLVLFSVSATAALYTRNTKQFNNESAILLEDIEASSCSFNDLMEFFSVLTTQPIGDGTTILFMAKS